jgi:hypothetical protein
MEYYRLFTFLHVACVIVWLGCGLSLTIRAMAAERRNDDAALIGVVEDGSNIFGKIFGMAAGGALVFGLILTWLAWSFTDLWIIIGLLAVVTSAGIGMFVVGGRSHRLQAMVERDGGYSPAAISEARQITAIARFDIVIFTIVVADMVFKPSPDSTVILTAMAVVLVAGALAVWRRLQKLASVAPA